MEIRRPFIDVEKGFPEGSRLGKSRRHDKTSERDRSVDKRVEEFRKALRSIGGCCNETDCRVAT